MIGLQNDLPSARRRHVALDNTERFMKMTFTFSFA